MTTKALIPTPTLTNPATGLYRWYRTITGDSEFKLHYDLRNINAAIKPFLDSLGCRYDIVQDDLVIIEHTPELLVKLQELKFQDLYQSEHIKTKYFKSVHKLTQGLFTSILYQHEYNFELYVVDKKHWPMLATVKNILLKTGTKSNQYYMHFMYIFRELL